MTTMTEKEREDLSLLLPWYVAGTLDEANAARIDAALEHDQALRAELELVLEDQSATQQAIEREEVPASMEARFHAALEKAIAQDARPTAGQTRSGGLLGRVAGFFAPPRRLAFAAVAAALVIAAQSGVIISLMSGTTGQTGYATATGEQAGSTDGLFVLARFAAGADVNAVSAWLAAHDGRVVDGPLPGGMFKLRFSAGAAADAAKLADSLGREKAVFAMVLPAG